MISEDMIDLRVVREEQETDCNEESEAKLTQPSEYGADECDADAIINEV